MSTAKEELTRLIAGPSDDGSREEIVRGLADSDAKRAMSNEDMGHRIWSWQK